MHSATRSRLGTGCFAAVLTLLLCSSVFAAKPSYKLTVSSEQYTPLQGTTPVAMEWWNRTLLKTNPHFPIDIGTESFSFFGTTFELDAVNMIGLSPYGEIKLENEKYYIDIYAFFTELDSLLPTTRVSYKVEGTPGDRILKVEWTDVGFPECPVAAFACFQLWVYQKTGVFEVRYGPRVVDVGCETIFMTNSGPFVSIFKGVQNSSKVEGVVCLYGNTDAPSITNTTFLPLTGAPKENTKYTFTPTGVATSVEESVEVRSVYPNPVSDRLSYTMPDVAQIDMRVVDMAGRTLLENSALPAQGEIDVKSLEPGTYLLELRGGGRLAVIKFVRL